VPDLRGRAIAGKDDMGGVSANRLTNQSGGVDGDTLGAAGGDETHTLTVPELPDSFYYNSNLNSVANTVDNYANFNFTARVADVISHTTQGSANGHNNVQPTLILTYIVKT
jgi:microcystin-dependent protein